MKTSFLVIMVLMFTCIQSRLFAACDDGGIASERFRETEREDELERDGRKGESEDKTDKEIKHELSKEITKRRKAGEVIPWTDLNSSELRYEAAVTANDNREHKGDAKPHSERIVLVAGCTNQTEYAITALLLHVKVSDEMGAVVSEGDVRADVALDAWESKRLHSVCVEATSKETSKLVGKIREMTRNKSTKTEVTVKQILWKNKKVTGNLPQ